MYIFATFFNDELIYKKINMNRVLVATGGGDCPGLNAVIRAISKRAKRERNWEVIGSISAFDGILKEPTEILVLDDKTVQGIHYRGGTIIGTTTKGGPFAWPVKNSDGTWSFVDRSEEMIRKLQNLGVDAVINIGGDGSQKISQKLYDLGLNIIGIPKTIDNDLSATDFTFGFHSAVQVATEAIDRLVTTAASHNRVIILEVMGRDAGWIALYSAIAGGVEVCLIPEIPYDINVVIERLNRRYDKDKGFAIIVIAEGARPLHGSTVARESDEIGNPNIRLGGVAVKLANELKACNFEYGVRETVLGHLQRGGTPVALDRIIATQFGVKAFEMVLEKRFGEMVAYRHPDIISVKFTEAIEKYNYVNPESNIVKTARGVGICLGDCL